MRKIFLDCGTHYGEGLEQISNIHKMDSSWEIYTWEANPHAHRIFKNKNKSDLNITSYQSAVSTFDGTIPLSIEILPNTDYRTSVTGEATTVVDLGLVHKTTSYGNTFSTQMNVACIDFSKWISKNCSLEDLIIVKLDIEGSEYSILEKMIEDETVKLVDEIYIEWHPNLFKDSKSYLDKQINIETVLNSYNIKINQWH
jgi:FkbM family methyltransferase